VVREVRAAYERFEFYRVHQRIYQFCTVELSSIYFEVLKDRLYADAPESPGRRAAQFVLARLHDHLTRLLAPILPHTAEELWDYRLATPDKPPNIQLAEFPEADPRWDDAPRDARWDELLALRERVLIALEDLRKSKQIGSAQEAKVRIATNRPEHWRQVSEQLAALCIVSEVEIVADPAATALSITTERAPYPKCERCWNYRSTVGRTALYPKLCERCVGVIDGVNARPRD